MKAIYLTAAGAIAVTFGLAACVSSPAPIAAPAPQATSTPAPTPTPTTAPLPVVQEPVFASYLDAPQTPGTWTYVSEPGETLALYGTDPQNPAFILRCGAGEIGLARVVSTQSTQARVMSITTETTRRQLTASPIANRQPLAATTLDPRDPLLDAMAITKGRFSVQVEGERTLYLPAWVEVSRVIEDCR